MQGVQPMYGTYIPGTKYIGGMKGIYHTIIIQYLASKDNGQWWMMSYMISHWAGRVVGNPILRWNQYSLSWSLEDTFHRRPAGYPWKIQVSVILVYNLCWIHVAEWSYSLYQAAHSPQCLEHWDRRWSHTISRLSIRQGARSYSAHSLMGIPDSHRTSMDRTVLIYL